MSPDKTSWLHEELSTEYGAQSMLHKEIWGLTLLAFIVWIFLSVDGAARISRVCRPLGWGGASRCPLTALVLPNEAEWRKAVGRQGGVQLPVRDVAAVSTSPTTTAFMQTNQREPLTAPIPPPEGKPQSASASEPPRK